MILTIIGQMPSGKNQIQLQVRNGRFHKYPNKTFERWRANACKQLMGQFQETVAWKCELIADYTPGDLHTRDVSGLLDALFHLLGHAGVIKDDGLIRNVTWREHPLDRKTPLVRIELKKI